MSEKITDQEIADIGIPRDILLGKTTTDEEKAAFLRAVFSGDPTIDNDPSSPHRGTDRTTKQLEEAKRIVASGTNVLFVCSSMVQALQILSREDVRGLSVAHPHNDASMRNLCRGRTGAIIVDHACPGWVHQIAREEQETMR